MMSGQSGNEEHLKQNEVPVPKVNTSHKENETNKLETSSSFQSEAKPEQVNEGISATSAVPKNTLLSNEVENNQPGETSNLSKVIREDQISEEIETVKQKIFKLPTESEGAAPSSDLEVVGDDFRKKNEVRILCECEPNVSGAAVPAVKSFIPNENQDSKTRCNKSNYNITDNNFKDTSQKNRAIPPKNKDLARPVLKTGQLSKEVENEKDCSNTAIKTFKCSPRTNHCFKPAAEKLSLDVKGHTKKPSLIPKPTRPSISNNKNLDKEEVDRRETVSRSGLGKLDFQKHLAKSDVKIKETSTIPKDNIKNTRSTSGNHLQNSATANANTISSRMIGLQERLKATTSMLRQKIELDKGKEKVAPEESCIDLVIEEEINKKIYSSTRTVEDLYKNIASLKDIASALSENNTLNSQAKYIEKLFRNISEIKLIADKLCMYDQSKSKVDVLDNFNDSISGEKHKNPQSSSTNTKDNKIYIKFMHSKDRKCDNKKRTKELFTDHSEEAQTGLALGSKLTTDSLHLDTCVTEKSQEEHKVKEADSMDGVFIPSCEPPKNMEDEEETNGLDITITFPEFSQLYSNGAESHLSVCLSDISAEALKKLKRCPKDFTLRMDFVEGKVLFQSGKGPANNFQIGPDLKFAENIVDTKKSDVISIKPSTECSFGSQLIPVENPRENKSYRSLKSTDSELFNVVSLPFLYKNPYLATNHKSCITLRNDQLMSMAKHIFKSMPQIPSLTNIFEDKVMENPSKTDPRKKAQKSPKSEKMD